MLSMFFLALTIVGYEGQVARDSALGERWKVW
jgi:hypothetical protein